MSQIPPPPSAIVDDLLARALEEDLGTVGDITTASALPEDREVTARIVAREAGSIAGLPMALRVFDLLGGGVRATPLVADGSPVAAGSPVARLHGSAHRILTGERTCLNLLGHLSGIATGTAELVRAVAGTGARITDTRKTTPGLRALERYAVRCGGGINHRNGLHDAVMLKDNHLAASPSIGSVVDAVRQRIGHLVKIEVEVDRLEQIPEAIAAGVDVILLDNMTPEQLRAAVELVDGRAITEASGGITLDTVRDVAASGVEVISVGWITHSVPRLDVALDLEPV